MSLLSVVTNALDVAWTTLGDLLMTVELRRKTRGAYDPATGAVSVTDTVIPGIQAAVIEYELRENPGTYSPTNRDIQVSDVRIGDQRCLLRVSDLPAGYIPRPEDTVKVGGVVWTVITVAGDPRIYWDLQLRK